MKIYERLIEQRLVQNEKDGLNNQNFDEDWILTIKVLWIFKIVRKYKRTVENKTSHTNNVGFLKK